MDAYNSFASELGEQNLLQTKEPAAAGGQTMSDVYSTITNKEDKVLDLIRRMDDTQREQVVRATDRISPLVSAFASGFSSFLARLVHYGSNASGAEVVGLISSPDGLVYTGFIVIVLAIILAIL